MITVNCNGNESIWEAVERNVENGVLPEGAKTGAQYRVLDNVGKPKNIIGRVTLRHNESFYIVK